MYPRLFIAFELPQHVQQSLAALQPQLPGLRTVPLGNLHLTLHFLGAAEVDTIAQLVGEVAASQRPFSFHLRGVGSFMGRSKILILWAGVAMSQELTKLHSQLGKRLAAVGLTIDQRPYQPHVTLARGERIDVADISQFLNTHRGYSIDVPAKELCLFRSETRHDEPVYSVLHRFPFQAPLPNLANY